MPPTHAELQAPPGDKHLAAIADALAPGSSVISVTRLTGGLDNGLHVLELDGTGEKLPRVVLRRLGGEGEAPVAKAIREWRTMNLLQELDVPVPEALLLDSNGELAGSPAIVISHIDGKPILRTSEAPDWTTQVASAIHSLHSADFEKTDSDFLGPEVDIANSARAKCEESQRFEGHPLGKSLRQAILKAIPGVKPEQPTIVHGDFWPGNTLWNDQKLLAIVDWSDAKLRDPAMDVGYMWMDLTIVGESAAAEDFVLSYERINGAPLQNLRLAKMLALSRAMPDPGSWMPSWVGSGRADLKVEDVRRYFSQTIERIVK